jgi:2,3-bisphosphoglycerate-independent phosphoglycerate mutase
MPQKKIILIIMDGWGLGKVASADAIQHANAPFTRSLYSKYPNTQLMTCGEPVGLPDGQMGNSEVGHLNLGPVVLYTRNYSVSMLLSVMVRFPEMKYC